MASEAGNCVTTLHVVEEIWKRGQQVGHGLCLYNFLTSSSAYNFSIYSQFLSSFLISECILLNSMSFFNFFIINSHVLPIYQEVAF